MKLRNKKTGEIIDVYNGQILLHYNQGKKTIQFKSIEELEEWEDYEEPKIYWHIDADFGICSEEIVGELPKWKNEIGNLFETEEEAKKAVEKLKAWKRLKDKGFRFTGINDDEDSQELITQCGILCEADIYHLAKDEDFLLLFGGEE